MGEGAFISWVEVCGVKRLVTTEGKSLIKISRGRRRRSAS